MPFQYHVREMTAETSAEEFVTRFVCVEKFLPFCQQCGSYNTRWTCPPFDFDPMTIWQSYMGLRLYARILQADMPEQPLDDWNYVKWLQSQLEHPDEKELMWLMEKLHQAAFSEDMLTKEEYEQCTGICREIKYHLEKKK